MSRRSLRFAPLAPVPLLRTSALFTQGPANRIRTDGLSVVRADAEVQGEPGWPVRVEIRNGSKFNGYSPGGTGWQWITVGLEDGHVLPAVSDAVDVSSPGLNQGAVNTQTLLFPSASESKPTRLILGFDPAGVQSTPLRYSVKDPSFRVDVREPAPSTGLHASPRRVKPYGGFTKMQHNDDAREAPDENIRKVGKMIADIDFAMFTTVGEDGQLHSRPMSTQKMEFDGTVWFFTYEDSPKVREVRHNPNVNLAYSDPRHQNYVSLAGVASIVKDRATMEELWQAPLKAWFPQGVDTPGIALLRVDGTSAEIWDSPTNPVAHLISLAKVAVTGKPANPGENVVVDLTGADEQDVAVGASATGAGR